MAQHLFCDAADVGNPYKEFPLCVAPDDAFAVHRSSGTPSNHIVHHWCARARRYPRT